MAVLEDFPLISQNSPITSDNLPNKDAQFECVSTSILAACMWLNGIKELGGEYTPDWVKDQAYGENYLGGTSASRYVEVCDHLGVSLVASTGNPGQLVQKIHEELAQQHPVVVTVPDIYVPASYGWTHVLCAFSDTSNTITMLDPWPGKPTTKSDAEWVPLLLKNQIWILSRKEEDMAIDLSMPEVASFFEATGTSWTCKSTGKLLKDGMLAYYQSNGTKPYCGLSSLGLPISNEIPLQGKTTKQYFERGVLCYDPQHKIDNPPGAGDVYPLHLYEGPGVDPLVAELQAQLTKQPASEVVSLQGKIAQAVKDLS